MDVAGLRARAAALAAVRRWFETRGYLEVPTPVLVPSPAMEEHLFAVRAADGWLRTSPEFALKKVLAAGLPRIYEIGPCFRERERGDWHGREFLMLEWYRVGASLEDLTHEVEAIVSAAAAALGVPAPAGWRRVTVRRLFAETTGVDLALASATDLHPADPHDWNGAFFRRWIEDVEPTLRGPTFVTEWPATQSALAQVRTDGDWPVTLRFEVFLGGVELANAFQELIDPAEQLRRFVGANAAREAAGEAPHPIDHALIDAVGRMAPTAGIAMGFDRLVAALSGWSGIAPGRVGD